MTTRRCSACGGEPNPKRQLMCNRCLNWFAEWARTHDRPPYDEDLPDFMEYSKKDMPPRVGW